jgi:hypothetical protein
MSSGSSFGKTVLLVDSNETMRKLRARLLRRYAVNVETADSLEAARLKLSKYDLVLIAPRENPEEAIQLQRDIKRLYPKQKVGFFVGPPRYISFTYGRNLIPMESRFDTWADRLKYRMASA